MLLIYPSFHQKNIALILLAQLSSSLSALFTKMLASTVRIPQFSFQLLLFAFFLHTSSSAARYLDPSLVYLWPLPLNLSFGNNTLSLDPDISLITGGRGGNSNIINAAFFRLKKAVFDRSSHFSKIRLTRLLEHDIGSVRVVVRSDDETLQLGIDESYHLRVTNDKSVTIEANTVYGALHGFETLSQLCVFDYDNKFFKIRNAPWDIRDEPRFTFRGILLDTSRHYLPVGTIKQILQSMSYAKFNVFHWHVIDRESFPLEVPSYPKLWKGSYTPWERYTVQDAKEIVKFAQMRGINVMAEVDVPGHAKSWGKGYPLLWPSKTCREPLDVSSSFTFDVISGILKDMSDIFPFELIHLGGDEVDTACWNSTTHIKKWLEDKNMTAKAAYEYFVTKAQQIAVSMRKTPVNWEETFNEFSGALDPRTVVHNWLGGGLCPKAVSKGFRCIYSNQGFWYLDHLDVSWEEFYNVEPLEGISDSSSQLLVIGGEACMWGETADASNIQETIWPRAAAAAERLWSSRRKEGNGGENITLTVLPRLHYFRCLLNRRGVPAAPVSNRHARRAPDGAGSCYTQ